MQIKYIYKYTFSNEEDKVNNKVCWEHKRERVSLVAAEPVICNPIKPRRQFREGLQQHNSSILRARQRLEAVFAEDERVRILSPLPFSLLLWFDGVALVMAERRGEGREGEGEEEEERKKEFWFLHLFVSVVIFLGW